MNSLKPFIRALADAGFHDLKGLSWEKRIPFARSGWGMQLDNPVHGGTLKDCSLLHFLPAIFLRPKTIDQLLLVVSLAFQFQIPITFAAGKT